jgi:hypothetical protein
MAELCACGDGRMGLVAETDRKCVLYCICGRIAIIWKRDNHAELYQAKATGKVVGREFIEEVKK